MSKALNSIPNACACKHAHTHTHTPQIKNRHSETVIISKIIFQKQRSWKSNDEEDNGVAMIANPMGGTHKNKPNSVGTKYSL